MQKKNVPSPTDPSDQTPAPTNSCPTDPSDRPDIPSEGSVGPVAVLLSLCVILFAPAIFQGKALFWADYFLEFFPLRLFARESLLRNDIPLWNPYLSGGMPFVGNLQSAVFYPPNVLYLILPVHVAFGVSALAHVFLFGLFTYLLLRHWRLGAFGALCGAITSMLCGFTVCRIEYPTILCAAVWLPLCVRWVDGIFEGDRKSFLLFPLALAAQFFAGHLQIAMMSFIVTFAYGILRWSEGSVGYEGHPCKVVSPLANDAATRQNNSRLLNLLIGFIVGMFLALPQLLPTLETLMSSTRAETSFEFASIYSLPPWQLICLFFPDAFGNSARAFYWGDGNFWELTLYTGIIGWLFLFSAFRTGDAFPEEVDSSSNPAMRTHPAPPRRKVKFFAGVAVVSLVIALGKFTPIYGWLYRCVPGFASFKGPGRFLFPVAFSAIVLIAVGADNVGKSVNRSIERFQQRTSRLTFLLVVVLAFLLMGKSIWLPRIAAFLRWQFPRTGASAAPEQFVALSEGVFAIWLQDLVIAAILLALVFFLNRRAMDRRLSDRIWKGGIVTLMALDLMIFGLGINPWTDPSLYTHESTIAKFLQAQKEDFHILTRPSIVLHTWGKYVPFTHPVTTDPRELADLRESLAPNLPMRYHLRDLEGYDPLKPEATVKLVQRINREIDEKKSVTALTQAGVRYIVGFDEKLAAPGLRKVLEHGGIEVHENLNWKPSTGKNVNDSAYSPQSFRLGMFAALAVWMLWTAVAAFVILRRDKLPAIDTDHVPIHPLIIGM